MVNHILLPKLLGATPHLSNPHYPEKPKGQNQDSHLEYNGKRQIQEQHTNNWVVHVFQKLLLRVFLLLPTFQDFYFSRTNQ